MEMAWNFMVAYVYEPWKFIWMFIALISCITLREQICVWQSYQEFWTPVTHWFVFLQHMLKYRYIPFTHGKTRYRGKEDTGKVATS